MSWDQPTPGPGDGPPEGWQQPGGPPGGFHHYPEASQAQTVFVLGILGLVLCQILAPIAWVMGTTEVNAIMVGRRSPDGLGNAKTGKLLGMIGTILIGVVLVVIIVAAVIGAAANASRS